MLSQRSDDQEEKIARTQAVRNVLMHNLLDLYGQALGESLKCWCQTCANRCSHTLTTQLKSSRASRPHVQVPRMPGVLPVCMALR